MEKSRSTIHEEDQAERSNIQSDTDSSREEVHAEDVLQVGKLHDQITKLQITAKNNCENIAKLTISMDKLSPLTEDDLIPTLKSIVKTQEANTIVAKNVLKIIGYLSAVVGLLYLVFHFWTEIKKLK